MSKDDVRKDEAQGNDVTVEFRGEKFTVTRDRSEWSLDLLEALEDDRDIGIIRGFLGPAQWELVKRMKLKAPEFDELVSALTVAMGFGSTGESPASVD